MSASFDELLAEAAATPFAGWDLSYVTGRMVEDPVPWDYVAVVRARARDARRLVDLGTGGGELLARLAPLAPLTVATEGFAPNVPLARARLEPVGAQVVHVESAPDNDRQHRMADLLPFKDSSFDLVIDRNEAFWPGAIRRMLRHGGVFVTHQVGGRYLASLPALLGVSGRVSAWSLGMARGQLAGVGLEILEAKEAFPAVTFTDVGALAFFLRAAPWTVPDFDIAAYRPRLAILHERIGHEGALRLGGHSFLLVARRP